MDDNHQPIDKTELLKNLTGRFSQEDLKTLSFQMGVDWDELEGAAKTPIAQTLQGAETTAIGQIVAATGLGGIGKTQ